MLNIFETGDESFRLADQRDVNVGWVRGSALGFDGFATEAEAVAAALAGSEALAGFLERLTGAAPKAGEGAARVRVVRGGAADGSAEGIADWVARGETRLARLYRPESGGAFERRHDTFGVEFVLPSYVRPGAAISAAQVLHKAIEADAAIPAAATRKVAGKTAEKEPVRSGAALPLGGAREGALSASAGNGTAR